MPLLADAPPGGGIFYLLEAPPRSAIQPLAADVRVEVREHVAAAVVRGIRASSLDDALDASLGACQQGLDLLAARGVVSVAITRIDTQHLLWWLDGGWTVLRSWGVELAGFEMRATGVVGEPGGRVAPPPPTPRNWGRAARRAPLGGSRPTVRSLGGATGWR
jgi:hypothetical protein